MNNQKELNKKITTNYISETYNSLIVSYLNFKNILWPNLSKKKQEVLVLLISLIKNQLSIFQDIINQKVKGEEIQTNLETLSKDIANILKFIGEKEHIFNLEYQNSFCITATKPQIKDQSYSLLTSPKHKGSPLSNSKDSFNFKSFMKVNRIDKYCKGNIQRETKSSKAKKVKLPNTKNNNKGMGNRTDYHSVRNLRSLNQKSFSPCHSCVEDNNMSSPNSTINSIKNYNKKRAKSETKAKIKVIENKLPLKYEAFAEKTIKDFERIGVKPTKFAKYLVKKYKDIVDKYEKLELKEGRRGNGNWSPDIKKDSNKDFLLKEKKHFKGINNLGITEIPMHNLEEEFAKKENGNMGRIIVVKKQK